MKTVVLVKQVPDTYGIRALLPDGRVDRSGADSVTDEINERALEFALQLRETHGGDVTVLTMGPESAAKSLRRLLASGADRAIHILDPGLVGADIVQTAQVLASALEKTPFDLIVTGNESTDGRSGAVPWMVAELLRVAQATFLRSATIEGDKVRGERVTPEGYQEVEAALPALISVTEQIAEPRFPSLKGVLAAKKKPLETVNADDLGLDRALIGGASSRSAVLGVAARPGRSAGTIISDDGSAVTQLIEFLSARKLT